MEVISRLAVPVDRPALRALRARAAEEAAALRGGPLLLRQLAGQTEAGGEDLQAVVEIDQVPVGYLEARLVPVPGGAVLCRIDSLYVEPEAREVGAGESLVALAGAWAREKDAVGIDAAVLPGAREAKNFFEGEGFVGRLIVMHRSLGSSR